MASLNKEINYENLLFMRGVAMNVLEPGVFSGSATYFHTCSALAKKMFFILCVQDTTSVTVLIWSSAATTTAFW